MKRRRVAILGSLAAFAIGGCGAPPTDTPKVVVPVTQPPAAQSPMPKVSPPAKTGQQQNTIDVETLAKGTKSDMRQPGYEVLRSQGELDSFIKQAGIKEAVPDVNWNDEMAVAVFGGERPGSIEIVAITDDGKQMTLKATVMGGTENNAATNHSYHLIVVPKSSSDVIVKGLPEGVATTPAASTSPSGSSGGSSSSQGQDQNVVLLVGRGTDSGVKQPINVIIRTADELKAVWDVHKQGLAQAMDQPPIDMNSRTIIGIFIGQSSTIGGIELDTVQPTQQGIVVRGHVVQGSGTAASPYLLFSIPKTNMPVDIQIQGAPQAQTLGNPQGQQQQPGQQQVGGQQQNLPNGMIQPGSGQMPTSAQVLYPNLGGANAQPPFPTRGSLISGGGSGGLLGAGGYVPGR